MRMRHVLTAVLGLAMVASVATAQRGQYKLAVGDQAPGLDIEKWVKGDETSLETGQVYVVEFWATWCVPCRKSIPHLTKLQKELGPDGLTIIGVSTEEADVVSKFVKKQGPAMDYTVVVDRRKTTHRAWMTAAGQNGIPAAFIVDREGKVAYIGHPLAEEFDSTLKKIMNGRYDPKLAKQAQPILDTARDARKIRNWRVAMKHYDMVIELNPRVFAEVALERFEMQLVDMGETDHAYDYASDVLINNKFMDDAGALGMLANKIISDQDIADRNLDVALEAAQRGQRLAGNTNVTAMATLARVHYHRGELEQAVKLQRRAWMRAKPNMKPDLKRDLDVYRESAERAVASR